MMKLKKLFYLSVVTLLAAAGWSSLTYAANTTKLIGCGPIQRAMGGTSVGLPLDAGVTITNPAGISEVGRRIDLGVTYITAKVTYRAASNAGLVTENNKSITSDTPPFILPAFGIVLPINDQFTFGLGTYAVCGIGTDYESNLYNNITYVKYTFLKFAPAITYSFEDKFSVGIAPNIGYATLGYEAGLTTQQSHRDDAAFGFGFTVGALIKPVGLLSLDLPEDFVTLGVAYESKQRFPDFEYNTALGKDKLELDQPQSFAAGIGLRPTEKLRLAFDISWIDWPQVIGKDMPVYTKNSSNASLWNVDWDDQVIYKFGIEYDLIEKIKLRAGYNYGKNPLNSARAFENIAFPTIGEHHITGGIGIDVTEALSVHFGFMYAPKVSLDMSNTAQFINSANIEVYQYSIDTGISYKF